MLVNWILFTFTISVEMIIEQDRIYLPDGLALMWVNLSLMKLVSQPKYICLFTPSISSSKEQFATTQIIWMCKGTLLEIKRFTGISLPNLLVLTWTQSDDLICYGHSKDFQFGITANVMPPFFAWLTCSL